MSDSGLASHTGLTPSGAHTFVAQYGNDAGMHAEFRSEPVYQEFESKGGELITGTITNRSVSIVPGKGRPVYRERVYCYITRPGAKSDNIKEVPMLLDDKGQFILDRNGLPQPLPGDGSFPTLPERFAKQWQQFLNKQEQTHDGTPLEMWPGLTKIQVLELKGAKIHTVEQLGMLPDSTLQNVGMMDARGLRDRAKAYMDNAENGAALSSALSVIEQQRIDIQALKDQFAQLAAERTEQPKRGPCRPPNSSKENE